MRTARLILLLMLVAGAAHAADQPAGAPPVKPSDLEGLWTTGTLTPFERPKDFKGLIATDAEAAAFEAKRRGKPPELPDDAVGGADSEWWETDVGLARVRGQVRSSWIVSPADGQTPYTPEAKAANKARWERRKVDFDHPEARPLGERCLATASPPMAAGEYNNGFRIVQTADALVVHSEWMNEARIIRIGDQKRPPASVRSWTGEAVGRWEGDTLVVESTNFVTTIVDPVDGDPNADMRVVERFRRSAPDELHYEFWVSNPSRLLQPMQGEMVFKAAAAPIFEFACHEGNYALTHVLAGARQQEQAADSAATGSSGSSPP